MKIDMSTDGNIYKQHNTVASDGKPHILVGTSAFAHVGLTTALSSVLQCSTLTTGIDGIHCPIVMWYFNPFAESFYEDTRPSHVNPLIKIPTQERAIIEFILLMEKLEEGIFIEGMKDYAYYHNYDYSKLYELAPKYAIQRELLDYWIKEAEEDYEV